jgi:hypothetical protein
MHHMNKQPAEAKIPAYSYAGDRERCGSRLRFYSRAAAEHLVSLSKVVARRNRRGALVAIVFRNELGGDPMLRPLKPGQKYSIYQRIGESHAWSLVPLNGPRADFQIVVSDVSTHAGRIPLPAV